MLNKKDLKFELNLKTLLYSIPFVFVPGVFGYLIIKFLKKDFTKLGPFGDFFAGTTVPILTFISFLALILTLKLQKEQIEMQREEIKETQIKSYQDSLPERIINLEESLDLVNLDIEAIQLLSRQDIVENLHLPSYKRALDIFELSGNYNIKKKDELKKVVEEDLKLIRNKMVRINTKSYKIYLAFQNSVEVTYSENIRSIEQKFIRFQQSILNKYPGPAALSDELEGEFAENYYDEEDFSNLNELKSILHFQEHVYITELAQVYYKFKYDLEIERITLVSELS